MNIQSEDSSYPDQETYESWETPSASRGQFLWLCLLLLSFSYELPLAQVTSMDRINPRLFDIVSLVGIVFVLPNLVQQKELPWLFRRWRAIIMVFGVCAFAWAAWIPMEHYKFTLFFYFRYLQGLLMIYMALKIPWSSEQKKRLHQLVVAGGVFVALYTIPEYLMGGGSRMLIEEAGKEIIAREGTLLGSLGPNYFHVAQYSALASIMTMALFFNATTLFQKIFYVFLSVFVAWPALFCGCRAGIALVALSWFVFYLIAGPSFKVTGLTLLVILIIGAIALKPKMLTLNYWTERSLGIQRLFEAEEEEKEGSSLKSRLLANWYDIELYRWQGIRVPFIGAGFHSAAHTYPDGRRVFRHGYGIHNCYLFSLEQGGLGAFIMFIWFLIACHHQLKFVRKFAYNSTDKAFAMGMHCYLFALLPVMMGGQIFWQGFGTVNFNTYLILLFCMATMHSNSANWQQDYWQEEYLPAYEDQPTAEQF
jgi:hypothetical protein